MYFTLRKLFFLFNWNLFSQYIRCYNWNFLFSKKFSDYPTLVSFLYLFSGSWAALLYFRASCRNHPEDDLVHQLTPNFPTIWYQPFASLLSGSKTASFSIATALISFHFQNNMLGSILAAFAPNILTSISLLSVFLSFPKSFSKVTPWIFPVLFRLFPNTFTIRPLYREAEMRGTFFAPLVIWFIALGIGFPIIFLFGWFSKNPKIRRLLFASIGPIMILHFLRDGTFHFRNAVAFCGVFYPIFCVILTNLLVSFSKSPSDDEFKGSAIFIMFFIFFFQLQEV